MTYETFDASAGTANLRSIADASVEIAVRDGDPFGWRSRWSVSCELARLVGLRPGAARSRHAFRILRHVHPDDLWENLAKSTPRCAIQHRAASPIYASGCRR